MSRPEVSIVVPMYNEEDNVRPLCDAVRAALEGWERTWELILVEDGSSDQTLPRLRQQAAADPRVRVVALKRNSGQTLAMATGFQKAEGDVIVAMDGDLQNDPRDIPAMVARLDDGFDVICGWRKNRKDAFLSRTLPSRVANKMIATLTGINIHDNGCSLKVYRAPIMKSLNLYAEMHRFLPALSSMTGARIDEVVVRHHPRRFGESKYGISRTFKVLSDMFAIKMVTQFANRPGRWFALLSLPFLGMGLVSGAIALMRAWTWNSGVSIIFPGLTFLFFYLFGNFMVLCVLSEALLHASDRTFLLRLSRVLTVRSEIGGNEA